MSPAPGAAGPVSWYPTSVAQQPGNSRGPGRGQCTWPVAQGSAFQSEVYDSVEGHGSFSGSQPALTRKRNRMYQSFTASNKSMYVLRNMCAGVCVCVYGGSCRQIYFLC